MEENIKHVTIAVNFKTKRRKADRLTRLIDRLTRKLDEYLYLLRNILLK